MQSYGVDRSRKYVYTMTKHFPKKIAQIELLLRDIFNRPHINDRLSINFITFDIVI